MKISLNTIRGLVERYHTSEDVTAIGVDKLVEKIGAQLGGVDEVINIGEKYQGIVIVKVVSCEKHPDADKLSLCVVDNGKEQVQVVCGAPNVRAGMMAAWIPPGATVPSTFGKEPFVLEARDIRGQKSNGMLASPKELDLSDNQEGILELPNDLKPGADFAKTVGLDDVIIDIENKMFTHRPDLFGFLGIARELAGIQHLPFKSPDWYVPAPEFPKPEADLPLTIKNELPELVPRFTALTLAEVKVGASPLWLQVFLAEMGQKSINNIVDYTNFYMLEIGQPLHAYDYDKVKKLSNGEATIVVRQAKAGEKVKLLNSKEVEPRAEAIMIATDKQPIGIGGVMGGSETEVDANTTNIILEAANFDMYSVRRTSMAHGLFTEAVTRFTKGQSPLQILAALAKITDEIHQHAGGKIAGPVIDNNHLEKIVLERNSVHPSVTVSADFINARLGLKLSTAEMQKLLEKVEFKVAVNGDELSVTAPFWRTDIELPEDIVEEVGRLYGYDHLPLELPQRVIEPTKRDQLLDLKAKIRTQLAKAGANEVLTYSFVHGDLFRKAGQNPDKAFEVANALSPDLQYYRLSLLPSLLEKVHPNIKSGYNEFALFELGKAHTISEPDVYEREVPKEVNALAFVYAAKKAAPGAPYYIAHKYLLNQLKQFEVERVVKLEPLAGADLYKNPWIEQMVAPFDPARGAVLRDKQGLIWGVVGEFKASVRRSLKLPDAAAGFELDPLLFLLKKHQTPGYMPLPRFPKVTQDITLKVPTDLRYQELFDFVWQELGKAQPENSLPQLSPISIYQGDDDKHKNVTLRLELANYDRTLTDTEVNKLLDTVAAAAKTKFDAQRI